MTSKIIWEKYARLTLILIAASTAQSVPIYAQTLEQTFAKVWNNNPELQSERAQLNAINERESRRRSAWKPNISANANYGYNWTESKNILNQTNQFNSDGGNISVNLTQSIFDSGRTANAAKQADESVQSARQNLRQTEQNILANVATAYMDVLRDRSIVTLRKKNVIVINEQLRASKARFEVGEITRTDVAQAEARLEAAKSNLAVAQANEMAANATYARIVGEQPGNLTYPEKTPHYIPKSLKQAVNDAQKFNPALQAAIHNEKASVHAVNAANAQLLPQISLSAAHQYNINPNAGTKNSHITSVTGNLSVPIYQQGNEWSTIREAKYNKQQRQFITTNIARQVRERVIQLWNQLDATQKTIISATARVKASQIAFDGVKEEAKVGQRTTLDVLDAEQELLDAQVSLVTEKRNKIVAEYNLIAAIGILAPQNVNLRQQMQAQEKSYQSTIRKLIGSDVRPIQ